ncbi:MAG: helix-turn-helix domain-containing protein [Clostridia bacterium]|nr:helix-turn-helix domain-containing protein [Clostridia bacterium]
MHFKLSVPPIPEGLEIEYYYNTNADPYDQRNFPSHIHNELEIYILLEGDVSFIVEKQIYRLSPGDAIIAHPNEIHNCILNSKSLHKHLCFWIRADNSFFLKELLSADFATENYISAGENRDEILALCQKFAPMQDPNDQLEFFSLAIQLFYFLTKQKRIAPRQPQDDTLPKQLRAILNYVNEHFASIQNIQDLQSKFFISRSSLQRMFKEYLHVTPHQYLETKKLSYSRILLKHGKSVVAVCMEAGFSDPTNYIRLFKKRFGITPRQYALQ